MSRIICAAIHIKDGKKRAHQPRNIDTGIVICGRRHHNCILTAAEFMGKDAIKGEDRTVQGFLTEDDNFFDREDSALIAFEAGQTDRNTKCLFSEDLY